ncbi:conjugal transfer protein TrbD [Helicobacter monodelphidis]|uniref:conjugal transfer protein TrbD n=1 Tax=Helicobacter sp. 15-1451 TaxID=2004995 RepID=UPI000DCC61F4|nr:conjugal transfer protein TrbD [Helicobacter sp. 15-1451]RAX56475.1 conjugal transfer protein TrbD [Helicobacter sp. 15-1451]
MNNFRIKIYSALNKPNLIFGCDRELILMTGVISFALIFVGMSFITFFLGVIILAISLTSLRLIAKKDPLMRGIFIRQLQYKSFYVPKATIFAETKQVH